MSSNDLIVVPAEAHNCLRWLAGALQAVADEGDLITMDGEQRTIGAILDDADKILGLIATQPAAGEPVAFANELINGAFQGGDFSGADIQELAVKHGLLREEHRDEACRDEGCACAEYGFPTECYRKTAALAPPAAAHGHIPSVSGIGRDVGHPRALVLYLRSEPTDDDIRAIQGALRGDAAAHGDEAVRKDADCQAQRDELLAALEEFYNANQARLNLLTSEVYLTTQRLPGMRDALYRMDDAQNAARKAIDAAMRA